MTRAWIGGHLCEKQNLYVILDLRACVLRSPRRFNFVFESSAWLKPDALTTLLPKRPKRNTGYGERKLCERH